MKLTDMRLVPKPSLATFCLGTALVILLTMTAFVVYGRAADLASETSIPPHLPAMRSLLTVLFIGLTAAAALLIAWHHQLLSGANRRLVALTISAGLLLMLVGISFAPIGSADVYWYTLSGRSLVLHGDNPYAGSPFSHADDIFIGYVDRWADHSTPYGPLLTALTALPILLSGNPAMQVRLMRALMVLGYVLAGLLIFRELRTSGKRRAGTFLALWFINPFAVFEVANAGHNEGLLALPLALLVIGLMRRDPVRPSVALTAAALMKWWPAILAPLLMRFRRAGKRRWVIAVTASILLMIAAAAPFGSALIQAVGLRHHVAYDYPFYFGPVLFILWVIALSFTAPAAALIAAKMTGGLLLLGLLIFVMSGLHRRRYEAAPAALLISLSFLMISPWVQPWYGIALLPFFASLKTRTMFVSFIVAGLAGFTAYSASSVAVTLCALTAYAIIRIFLTATSLASNPKPRPH
ncbi:hypothetical protein AMJ57_00725 [Parcubacteria bacterium SG8_24]|nr:MAG: hypothetical protein AMJ57_00725 [Parcubacteria bacterium SG8_24]